MFMQKSLILITWSNSSNSKIFPLYMSSVVMITSLCRFSSIMCANEIWSSSKSHDPLWSEQSSTSIASSAASSVGTPSEILQSGISWIRTSWSHSNKLDVVTVLVSSAAYRLKRLCIGVKPFDSTDECAFFFFSSFRSFCFVLRRFARNPKYTKSENVILFLTSIGLSSIFSRKLKTSFKLKFTLHLWNEFFVFRKSSRHVCRLRCRNIRSSYSYLIWFSRRLKCALKTLSNDGKSDRSPFAFVTIKFNVLQSFWLKSECLRSTVIKNWTSLSCLEEEALPSIHISYFIRTLSS